MKAKLQRARFIDHAANRATLEYTDEHGDAHSETYRAHDEGGYVYCTNELGISSQPCDGLAHTGSTLLWRPQHGRMVDVIRREWKKTQAALRKVSA